MIIDRIVQSNREPDKHALWRKGNSLYYFSSKGWEEVEFFPSLKYNNEDHMLKQELESLKNKYAISDLVERKKIVAKEKEPNKNVLWLQDNVIKEMSPSGWNNIAKSSSLEELNDAIKGLEDYSCIELVFIKGADPRKCEVTMRLDNKTVTITLPEGTPQYCTYKIEKPSVNFYLSTGGIVFIDDTLHTTRPDEIAYYDIRKFHRDYIEGGSSTTTWPPERLNRNRELGGNFLPTTKLYIYVDMAITTTTTSSTSTTTLPKDIRINNMTPFKAKVVVKSGSNKIDEFYLQPAGWGNFIKREANYTYEVQLLDASDKVIEISLKERFGIKWENEELDNFTFSDDTDTIKFKLSDFTYSHSPLSEINITEHTLSTTTTTTTTTKPKGELVVKIVNNSSYYINDSRLFISMGGSSIGDYGDVIPGSTKTISLNPKSYHNVAIRQLAEDFMIENIQLISPNGDITPATYYENSKAYAVYHNEDEEGLQIIEVIISDN